MPLDVQTFEVADGAKIGASLEVPRPRSSTPPSAQADPPPPRRRPPHPTRPTSGQAAAALPFSALQRPTRPHHRVDLLRSANTTVSAMCTRAQSQRACSQATP